MDSLADRIAAMKLNGKPRAKKTAARAVKKAAPKKRPVKKKPTKAKKKPQQAAPKQTVKRVATAPNKDMERATIFAHAYVRYGCNATRAYKELNQDVTNESAQVEGHRMLSKPMVQGVLAPLLEALMEKGEVDAKWVLMRWYENSMASPLDYFTITDDGQLGGLDLSAITDAQRTNLRSIEQVPTEYGTRIKVTVVDQQKATEMFAKYLKMLVPKLDEEDIDRIGDLLEEGVKRIRKQQDLGAWKDAAIEGKFTEVDAPGQ